MVALENDVCLSTECLLCAGNDLRPWNRVIRTCTSPAWAELTSYTGTQAVNKYREEK